MAKQDAPTPGLLAAVPAPAQLGSDRKIHIGVVGGGFGASFQWHLDPNCVVEAVSDLQPGRRAHLQRVYKCEKAYESLEKLILDPKIDAVAVFTGAPDHARHTVMCMNHGKHVISAVPACVTVDEAAQMKAAKEKTGLTYMMAETSYYRRECIFARQLWTEKAFGNFLYSEVEYYHHSDKPIGSTKAVYNGKLTKHGWRWGYPPMLYPTHSTAFHVGVSGERLTTVSCLGWGHDKPWMKENPYNNPFANMVALFDCSGGNICRCNVFWWIHAGGERAQWIGENYALYMGNVSGQPFGVRTSRKDVPTAMPNYTERLPKPMRVGSGHGGSHTYLTHEFIAALIAEREPAVSLYESLAMTVPGIVAMDSAHKGGERLKVPSFDKA